jgi:Putative adhesin
MFFSMLANAQTTLQVASKNIERTLPYKQGYELSLEGEKADVTILAGANGVIKVSVEIFAENPSLIDARVDLEQVQFEANVAGQRVILRNYIKPFADGKKPKSNLKTIYRIYVPSNCAVDLKNKFGKANISNLFNFFKSKTEFCNVTLQNMNGGMNIESKFGDVVGSNISGEVYINATRSNVNLKQLRGSYFINNSYGNTIVDASTEQINLKIYGEQSNVVFYAHQKPYNYDISAKGGDISLPKNLSFMLNDHGEWGKNALQSVKNTQQVVTIKVNFGSVKVID